MSAPHVAPSAWDHSSHEAFYNYYAAASQTVQARARFTALRDCVLRVLAARDGGVQGRLAVADIGCGAGTQALLWAELGHRVHGLDVNGPLIELARERARAAGHAIDYRVGSAVALPWPDASMDICLVPELLEHVPDWQACVREFTRILRPGGVLLLTTTNALCPIQHEFELPLYSWYPAPLKRYCEKLATTTRPALVNFARYPAVNWFTFYRLRRALARHGLQSFDRFDVMDLSARSRGPRVLVRAIRALSLLRWLAHVVLPGTIVVALKPGGTPR